MGSFWPAHYGSEFHFCNKPPGDPRTDPPDYNFLARYQAQFDHVRLSPMLPWPQSLEIGFMLPNRSAGASRFWKLGYLSLSLPLQLHHPPLAGRAWARSRQASARCRAETARSSTSCARSAYLPLASTRSLRRKKSWLRLVDLGSLGGEGTAAPARRPRRPATARAGRRSSAGRKRRA